MDKVVLRFRDGKILKGHLSSFSDESKVINIDDSVGAGMNISSEELKAIFFVKSFEGDKEYRERKAYSRKDSKGRKIYVRFTDNEALFGYLENDMPREKGFYLFKRDDRKTGFFVLPVDDASNNIKVFVFNSAVKDVASIG